MEINKNWDSSECSVPYVRQLCLRVCAQQRCCVPCVRHMGTLYRGSGGSQEPVVMKSVGPVSVGSQATVSRSYSVATLTDWVGTLWVDVDDWVKTNETARACVNS